MTRRTPRGCSRILADSASYFACIDPGPLFISRKCDVRRLCCVSCSGVLCSVGRLRSGDYQRWNTKKFSRGRVEQDCLSYLHLLFLHPAHYFASYTGYRARNSQGTIFGGFVRGGVVRCSTSDSTHIRSSFAAAGAYPPSFLSTTKVSYSQSIVVQYVVDARKTWTGNGRLLMRRYPRRLDLPLAAGVGQQ